MTLKQVFHVSLPAALVTAASLAYAPDAQAVQVCLYDSVPSTAPLERFTDDGDGTLTDSATGLQWKRCSEGQSWTGAACSGSAAAGNWQFALQLAEDAQFAGHSDWRVPNVKELGGLVERACTQPAIDAGAFPDTPPASFWSSSPSAFGGDSRWLIRFENGYGIFAGSGTQGHVRLVRDTR
ncbi:MAG: DUF1566 domain-containing protein [Thiohalocapsa sp.]|jgi:hypothetical protein|nr:DUF1566 domain-containing protein [Thiohalocapsa sp.]MCF7992793.1 DUF1566 domain-containing protein [Thiohalocapsa sp.]